MLFRSAPDLPNSVSDLSLGFYQCYNLVNGLSSYPTSCTNLYQTFTRCEKLTSVPGTLPPNITNLAETFRNCKALTSAPAAIPDKVVNCRDMFSNCRYMVTGPVSIGNACTNMYNAFKDGQKLTTAPSIGNKVTKMSATFMYCYQLIGTIQVNSPSVTNFLNCFYGTLLSKSKTLRVPAGSASYTAAMAQCDGRNGVTVVGY